eukprot:5472480-Prymnesium_polylepis.1
MSKTSRPDDLPAIAPKNRFAATSTSSHIYHTVPTTWPLERRAHGCKVSLCGARAHNKRASCRGRLVRRHHARHHGGAEAWRKECSTPNFLVAPRRPE